MNPFLSEFPDLNDYVYQYELAPKESKAYQTVLVYMYKKANLKLIEDVFKANKIYLRQIISRYQIINELLLSSVCDFDSSSLACIDVSKTRARLFFCF